MASSRRIWIRQASFTLAALGIGPAVLAKTEQQEITGFPATTKPSGNIIFLNRNENAYGPSTNAQKAMTKALSASNRYPDEEVRTFKKKLASYWQTGSENILMSAGSSEILGLVSLYLGRQRGHVVTAIPSYNVWEKQAEQFGLSFVHIPLNDDKKLDLDKMLSAVNAETRMVYICNPNNPTGTYLDHARLQSFVVECSKKCFVLVDEAYTEFAELKSLAPEAAVNPNILVAKPSQKYTDLQVRVQVMPYHIRTPSKNYLPCSHGLMLP